MNLRIHWSALELFRKAVHLWLILFVITALPAYDTLWVQPISPTLPASTLLGLFTQAFTTWAEGLAPVGLAVLLVASTVQLLKPARWWLAVLIWMCYVSLMNLAWLAGSGGQQLIANVLFWSIFIPARGHADAPGLKTVAATAAFWIIRMQLLLAYAATAVHKLTGVHWPGGTALGIVASDPAFGPEALAHMPLLASLFTWSILFFQLTFPIAVWSWRTRIPWMLAGVLFHLATAIALGIPEMAMAFVACYAIWLNDRESDRLRALFGQGRVEEPAIIP